MSWRTCGRCHLAPSPTQQSSLSRRGPPTSGVCVLSVSAGLCRLAGTAAVCHALDLYLSACMQPHPHTHTNCVCVLCTARHWHSLVCTAPPVSTARLYRVIQNLESHLGCWLQDGTPFQPPSGWELVTMLNITEPASAATSNSTRTGASASDAGDATVTLPFAAVLLNREAQQLVVAIRGTMTGPEWQLDFTYK